jgi:hypothetical protein
MKCVAKVLISHLPNFQRLRIGRSCREGAPLAARGRCCPRLPPCRAPLPSPRGGASALAFPPRRAGARLPSPRGGASALAALLPSPRGGASALGLGRCPSPASPVHTADVACSRRRARLQTAVVEFVLDLQMPPNHDISKNPNQPEPST